ncbi:MAG: hypothetical protein ACM3JH_09475 [Acidithiobacillales bacterium]
MILTTLLAVPAATAERTPAPPTPMAVPGPAGLQVPWTSTWDEAVAAARKIPDGRILIYFSGKDCGPCERMEALVVPSTSFFAFTRDKVPLRLTLDSPEGKRLAARLRLREIPAWVVVTPELVVTGRQEGSTTQMGWVEAFVEAERGWALYKKLLAAEKADPSDLKLVFEVARESFLREGDSFAEPRFLRLASDPRTPPGLREQSLAYLASIQLDAGRPDDARVTLDRLLAIVKDPVLKQRAELRRAEVEIAVGRKDLAIGRLEAFQKEWPGSPLVPDAARLLEALKAGTAGTTERRR